MVQVIDHQCGKLTHQTVALEGHAQVDRLSVNLSVPTYTALVPAHVIPYISLARFRNYREFYQGTVILGVVCF